ncbi:hypothetical protein HYV73_01310 [Candidatus Uhrbacteria bacterium]|nr:hypothetical protein [Candidatus Uhrbacteria bacterium]
MEKRKRKRGQRRERRPAYEFPQTPERLARLVRRLTSELRQLGAHLKREPHEYHARKRFERMHNRRAEAFVRLKESHPRLAQETAEKAGLCPVEE